MKAAINDFKNGKITALIAVRTGSIRCVNKNTKPFGDSNLLTLKIKTLQQIPEIDKIILTTNCEISKLIGKKMNIIVKDRPDYYCSDSCSGNEMLNYIASQCDTEHILYSPVTSPFISIKHIQKVINIYKKLNNNYDCVITKSVIKDFIWDSNKPINYTVNNFPRSQDLTENIFSINFGCCIIPKSIMMERNYMIGYNPLFIKNDDKYGDIDIDYPLDFDTATLIYNNEYKNKNPINFLDVTIRDGGFTNNWSWSYDEVVNLYNLFSLLKYKYFEIGYFINDDLKEEGAGIWRNLPFDILKNFPLNNTCKISAMIDHWKYDLKNLPAQHLTKINLIRVTSYKENIKNAIEYCKLIKDLGYEVSLNLIVGSWINEDDMNNIVKIILEHDNFLDYIFIADSYGNLNPDRSNRLINYISSYLNCIDIPVGFHIHDTAGIGFANAINSIKNGVKFLDTSLFGLGKGVGNLSCNNLLIYLKANKIIDIDISELFKYIDKNYPEQYNNIAKTIAGFYNIHPTSFDLIKDTSSLLKTYNKVLLLTTKEKYHYSNLISLESSR